jgi:hypothetical protein
MFIAMDGMGSKVYSGGNGGSGCNVVDVMSEISV